MYTFTHTVETTAVPEAVWELYSDVARWRDWDAGLVDVTLDGPFAVGSEGVLTVEGQPPLPFRLTAVEEARSFSDVTQVPGVAVLEFHHHIEPSSTGSVITHEVVVTGPAALQFGPAVTSDMPEAMESLARLAERRRS